VHENFNEIFSANCEKCQSGVADNIVGPLFSPHYCKLAKAFTSLQYTNLHQKRVFIVREKSGVIFAVKILKKIRNLFKN